LTPDATGSGGWAVHERGCPFGGHMAELWAQGIVAEVVVEMSKECQR
jgi:hypothetical protein